MFKKNLLIGLILVTTLILIAIFSCAQNKVDPMPPLIEILSFTPDNDATGVALNTTIQINFDGSVTRSDGEISLVNGSTSTPIATDESQITYQS